MEFPVPVEAEDGVEVAGRAVEEILPVIQGVGVADLQETWNKVKCSQLEIHGFSICGFQ